MAYLGSTPNYGFLEGQTVTFNGSTTQVTLNRAISTPDAIDVFIDNVHQEPDVAYTVDAGGGSITFTGTPVNGAVCYIRFHGQKFDTAQASQVIDSDGDTHVKVEASSDSDTVVVTAGGTVAITANSSGVTIPNLTVTGTTTSVNSTNLNIGDNQITLNSDVTGTPSENAGLIVNRGSASDVSFLWNETSDYWIVNEPLVSATRINAIVSGNTPSLDGDNIGLFQNSASSQNAIVSIISNSSNYSQLNFGDENDENAGYLRYNNSSDLFTLNSPITISGALTANSGINIDNITIDGQEIDVSSGDLTIDVAGNIHIDANGGSILLKDDGTQFGLIAKVSDGLGIYASVADKDIFFKGTDGSSAITALTLDMSNAGTAIFNSNVNLTSGNVSVIDGQGYYFGDGSYRIEGKDDGANARIGFVTGGTERMRIDSNGHIGIGNTVSGFNAQADNLVVGTGSGANGITIYSGNDSTANIFFADGTGDSDETRGGINYNHSNNSMNLRVNDAPKMYILSSGNVGIGTSSPSTRLAVEPSARTTNFSASDYTTYADILVRNPTNDNTCATGIAFITDAELYTNGASGIAAISGVGDTESSLAFITRPINAVAAERMRITSAGNVGIGTTSPDFKLQVSGTNTQIGIESTTTNQNASLYYTAHGANQWEVGCNITAGLDYEIYDRVNNATRMVVNHNGNVGIGTSSPDATAHLEATNASLLLSNSGRTQYFRIQNNESGDAFTINSNDSSERMRIASNGYIEFRGASQVRVNLGNAGTAGTNNSNWIRGSGNNVGLNTNGGTYGFEVSGTTKVGFAANGDVTNATGSYGTISDETLKENISDTSSQWNDVKALKVRKYSMKEDDLDSANKIGVIAQELETSGMNGLVKETEWNGETVKSVKYSILYMKAVKALQEAMTRIETLEARITTLENA